MPTDPGAFALSWQPKGDRIIHIERRRFLIVCGGVAVTPLAAMGMRAARAQGALPRVTLVIMGSVRTQSDHVDAFRHRLRELGYVEGKNLILDIRELQGRFDQLPRIMGEIVQSNPNVIVTHGVALGAAKDATSAIPIVAAISSDPVKGGFAASLARPGGNFTGNAMIAQLSFEKTVQILHEIAPNARRVGLLIDPTIRSYQSSKELFEAAAAKQRMSPVLLLASGLQELPKAIADAVAKRVDMLIVAPLAVFSVNPKVIVDLSARHRLPTIYSIDSFVAAGGLVFYGYSGARLFGNAAVFVDRILKGRKPGELPFEQPTKFELVINLKTAKALGLKIPQSVLIRADRVIE